MREVLNSSTERGVVVMSGMQRGVVLLGFLGQR